MFYKVEYQKRAHQEVEKIFRVLFPEQGLAVREEQIRLCHEMLDTLLGEQIALCDAGVGIGKTYAYLVACVLLRKYSMLTGRGNPLEQRPVVVSTSSIALQKAILTEYIPFLSRVLLEQGIIQSPLRAVVRKGKEHFVCDNRLEQRIEAIRHKQKNAAQKEALLSLRKQYDMDSVKNLSGFDRRLVCVPKFCPRECPGRQMCRYQRYLEESRKQDVFIQICNHNYLLADAYHRAEGYKPLLSDYRTLIVDEAHKLPEAARQMFGKNLCMDDIREIAYYLEREHQKEEARILRTVMCDALHVVGEEHQIGKGIRETFCHTTDSVVSLWEGVEMLELLLDKLEKCVPKWIRNRLEDAKEVLECFCSSDEKYVRYLRSRYREASHFMCSQSGNPRIASEDGMGSGRRCVCHLNQRNAKGGCRFFAHPADHRAGRENRSAGICGRVPLFLRKELSVILAKDAGALQKREQGRGSDGGKPDPFPDLFHLRTYVGTVYLLYIDGKCVPDFKRQPAISHGGSMEAFPGRNFALQDHGEWGAVCSRLLLGRGRLSGRYGIFADYCETAFCSTGFRSARQRRRRMTLWNPISSLSLCRICRRNCARDLGEPSGQKLIPAWCLF